MCADSRLWGQVQAQCVLCFQEWSAPCHTGVGVGTSLFSFPLKLNWKIQQEWNCTQVQTIFITSVKCCFQPLPGSSVQLSPFALSQAPLYPVRHPPYSSALLREEGKDIFQLAWTLPCPPEKKIPNLAVLSKFLMNFYLCLWQKWTHNWKIKTLM